MLGETDETHVFSATREGVTVTIKVCRKPTVKLSADMWKNEIRILKDLDHPSITKLLHYDVQNLRLELEYVGQDLSKFVDAQHMSHLSEDTAYQIWQDVSNRLKYIHRKGVIHLDIKPQNILLDKGGQAKICDFGSSVCAVVPVPYNGGTSHYTPPEYILSGERGPAGDIWGLGITMGFVLGLEPLPRGRGWTIAKVGKDGEATRKMYQWLDHVKRRIKETPDRFSLLRKMLLVDPGYRITSSELVNSLRTIPRIKALMGLVV